jgi:hypothetical protein
MLTFLISTMGIIIFVFWQKYVIHRLTKTLILFYENQASQTRGNSFIKIQLKGGGKNPNAVGAYIIATDEKGQKYHYENQPARGFESCMDPRINIGLGKAKIISLEVLWPSGKKTIASNVKVNQLLKLDENPRAQELQKFP